jgi:hypothetical protein
MAAHCQLSWQKRSTSGSLRPPTTSRAREACFCGRDSAAARLLCPLAKCTVSYHSSASAPLAASNKQDKSSNIAALDSRTLMAIVYRHMTSRPSVHQVYDCPYCASWHARTWRKQSAASCSDAPAEAAGAAKVRLRRWTHPIAWVPALSSYWSVCTCYICCVMAV